MDCSKARRLLDPLVDGALDAKDEAAVLGHTQECPACAQELRELERICEMLDGLGPMRARPGFVGQVAMRLRDQEPAAKSGWDRAIANLALAMFGALGLSMILVTLGDLLAGLSNSEAGADLVQSVGDLAPLIAVDGLLVDPLAFVDALHESSLSAINLVNSEFLLGTTLVLVVCFVALFQLLAASHPRHQGLGSRSLQR